MLLFSNLMCFILVSLLMIFLSLEVFVALLYLWCSLNFRFKSSFSRKLLLHHPVSFGLSDSFIFSGDHFSLPHKGAQRSSFGINIWMNASSMSGVGPVLFSNLWIESDTIYTLQIHDYSNKMYFLFKIERMYKTFLYKILWSVWFTQESKSCFIFETWAILYRFHHCLCAVIYFCDFMGLSLNFKVDILNVYLKNFQKLRSKNSIYVDISSAWMKNLSSLNLTLLSLPLFFSLSLSHNILTR